MNSPWLERRVVAFAHQGGAFEGPSSTLFAIANAIEQGASAIELDVHATADRRIVVSHDEMVDRTTNGRGEIAKYSLGELEELDNAYWWVPGTDVAPNRAAHEYVHRGKAPGDRRFAVATLEEVVRAFPGVALNLDIKRTDPEVEPYEQLLADEVRRLECTGSVIVASFLDSALQHFRTLAPEVITSAATEETASFYFRVQAGEPVGPVPFAVLQVPATFGEFTVVDERFVARAHDAGLAVHVWTVNEVDEMDRLLDLGVDGIISDTPTSLVELLRTRGCAWDGVL